MRRFLGMMTVAAACLTGGAAMASECFQLARAHGASVHLAAETPEAGEATGANRTIGKDQVAIRFIAHSSYLLEDSDGLQIATDWSGDFESQLDRAPDVATMNHAHITHWSPNPDPEIDHVLEGWGEKGKPRKHFLRLGETLIRNVPTDIRASYAGAEPFGNSIFLFEMGDLCIGHLGHIHHEPTEEQYALLGRLDVVMVPVDGTWTLGIDDLIPMLQRMRAQVVLPMHAFGSFTLAQFLDRMREDFAVEFMDGDDLLLSQKTLPDGPTVMVPKGL